MARRLRILLLSVPLALLCAATMQYGVGNRQFMQLDPTGKYIVNQATGKPVFMVGEDGFLLFTELCNADAQTYLATRASQGFNVVWAALADNIYQNSPPANCYGSSPFSGSDFTNEVGSYWAHVDYVTQLAASYGITLMMDPAFVGLNSSSGYLASYQSASCGTLTAYGAWLGARYMNYSNIIWALGGDWNPSALSVTQINCLAAGIRQQDTVHLMTVEACRFCTPLPSNESSMDAYSGSPAMNINWVYAPYSSMQTSCASNYARSGALPAVAGEDWYEGENSMTALDVREEGWWETLSGCSIGRIFGNNPIWCFGSTNTSWGTCNTSPSWQASLTSGGSTSEEYIGQLMRSREFWKMVPDSSNSVLTGGIGSGTSISVGACTSDGQSCTFYDPLGSSQPLQINMVHFSGTVHAWWFNPATGATTDLSTFANSGTDTFTPSDTNDWALQLDLNSAGLPAPGTSAE
jgi:hypothetical protein